MDYGAVAWPAPSQSERRFWFARKVSAPPLRLFPGRQAIIHVSEAVGSDRFTNLSAA